jgi:putative membrane protein
MFPGFIPGSRATLMLDIATIGMAVIVPAMIFSICLAKYKNNYVGHRKIQLLLGLVLLLVVGLFELDMRIFGWEKQAEASPYYQTSLYPVLYVHLCFAISTSLLWIYMIVGALRQFARVPEPNAYSSTHKLVGKLTALDTVLTAVTGWIFYYMAFVA